MATARPLRDVFADVAGDEGARASDPAELLRTSGHGDLPDHLVAEAVTSYADTAPVEVAEHLSPYVMANSAVPGVDTEVDASSWLDALATAPEVDDGTVDPADAGLDDGSWYEPDSPTGPDHGDVHHAAFDIDFGVGDAVDHGAATSFEHDGSAADGIDHDGLPTHHLDGTHIVPALDGDDAFGDAVDGVFADFGDADDGDDTDDHDDNDDDLPDDLAG
jgi:hypothetical protein